MYQKFNYLKKTFLVIVLYTIGVLNVAAQTTFTVTSTSVTGSGSFTEAIDLANANPGADIIEFTPGLQVDASVESVTPATSIMAHITESVLIDGKDGALNGIQMWIDASGNINSLSSCPGDIPGTIQSAYMPGFIEIGTSGADNSGIDVSIKNLTIKQFNQVAVINKNASLELENFTANDTWATFECLNDQMIEAGEGASLTIRDSEFLDAFNWADPGILAAPIAALPDAGDLTIEGSVFKGLYDGDNVAILWDGDAGSTVNIVSSRFQQSGGIFIDGESETNIVNTIWTTYYFLVPKVGDIFVNRSSADMNLIASSFVFNSNECDGACQAFPGFDNLFEIAGAGNINFSQSGVGFNWDPATGADELNTLGINGGSGAFTADEFTWIQATTQQDAAALQTITSQPALLTDLLGFNRSVIGLTVDFDVEMATPAFPGELIDVIPSGNPLINPIDGSTITMDVVGNPREDANGERDIGALQLGLAPFLAVTNSGDSYVALSWNEPLHHDGNTIIRYELVYDEAGGSSPLTDNIDASSTGHSVGSLTNGTAYEFKIRAIYDDGSGGEIEGPFSNTVIETPYGTIDAPVVQAFPTDSEVALSWNLPDLGGNQFSAYIVKWRIGSGDFIGAIGLTDINTLSYTVPGLTNGTEYEFSVLVVTFGGTGPAGVVTATPGIYYYYKSTAVGGDWEGTSTWTRSLTEDGTYEATTDQPTDLNSLSVIITNSAGVTVSTPDKTCRTLSVEDGGVLTIGVSGSLSTIGVVSTTDTDGLIIKSDATGTGSLIHGSGAPLATVERYVPMDGWHFVSPSTTGVTPQNFYINKDNAAWLTKWDEPSQNWTYFVDPLDEPLPLGTGYSYWWQDSPAREMTVPGTVEFKGNLQDPTIDLIVPLTNDGIGDGAGFNLIGNPWACAVSVDPGLVGDLTNCEETIWIWNNTANGGAGWFEWAAVGTPSGSNNNPLEMSPTDIAAGQGLYLRALSGGGSIDFNGSAREHVPDAIFWKKSEIVSNAEQSPIIQLWVSKDGKKDRAYIMFGEEGTTGFENGIDVTKLFGAETESYIYLNEEDHNYAQNFLSSLEAAEERVVDVYVRAGSEGEHAFTVNMDYLPNTLVVLEDTETGDLTEMNNDVVYTFSAKPGDAENRFKLHFTSGVTGIENPELGKDNAVKIYSYNKAIYISNKDNSSYESAKISIFDMYGRKISSTQTRLENKTRIPVNINNSYLLVRVVVGSNTYIEKVFVK